VTIPALAGEQEPRDTVSIRLSSAERLGLQTVAWAEKLPTRRPTPNLAGAVYLFTAYGFRHCPPGWRPANGLIVPGQGEPAPIANRTTILAYLVSIGTDRELLQRIIHDLPDDPPGTTQDAIQGV
jgi:hypothetical protein